MRVSNQISNNTMYSNRSLTKAKPANFQGWAACPLKSITLKPDNSHEFKPLLNELRQKCGKYFDINVLLAGKLERNLDNVVCNPNGDIIDVTNFIWAQDYGIFLNSRKMNVFMYGKHDWKNFNFQLGELSGCHSKETYLPLEGGNCFLGKKPDGAPYAIVGINAFEGITRHALMDEYTYSILLQSRKQDIANELGVKVQNLYIIKQPDFHLDLAIRPLHYPYVLVGDPNLTIDLAKQSYPDTVYQSDAIYRMDKNRIRPSLGQDHATPDETVKQLESFGFKPIKVPGLLGHPYKDLNYMNAIVHQDSDGKLIYVTNRNNSYKTLEGINFERIFVDYLKEHVPSIKRVIFIDAKGFIQQMLYGRDGGIHCLSLERPDFRKWNTLLRKQNSVN